MAATLRRIAVVGAGLAGLACALAAARRGVRVHVFEQASAARALPGHVEVVPSLLRDLVALGVADECVRAGFPYHAIDVFDRRGARLFQLPTPHLAGPRYPAALGIRQAELHAVLERAARERGVTVLRGTAVEGVRERGAQVALQLTGGQAIDADLVVLAAGAPAALRGMLFPHAAPAADIGQWWWITQIHRPLTLDRPSIAIVGAGRRVLMVPVRADSAGLVLVEPRQDALPASPAQHMRRALSVLAPSVRQLAAQIQPDTPVTLRPARSGLLPAPWHRGGVLAVGECAHALPPHLGQAAAQAVEDARVLGELLAEAPDRAGLLEAFQKRRLARVARVHELTTAAAHWDLKPDGVADLNHLMEALAQTVAQPA